MTKKTKEVEPKVESKARKELRRIYAEYKKQYPELYESKNKEEQLKRKLKEIK